MGDATVFDGAAQFGYQKFGGGHARVGHQQGVFEFFVKRFVNLRAAKRTRNAGRCFAQTGLELVQPLLPLGRRGRGQRDLDGGDERRAYQRAASGKL